MIPLGALALAVGGVCGWFYFDETAAARSTCQHDRHYASFDTCFEARTYGMTGWLDFSIAGTAAAVALAGIGAWASRRPPPFVTTLEDHPEQVVWIYQVNVHNQLTHRKITSGVVLGLQDGRRVELELPSDACCTDVIRVASRRVPEATVGHDPYRERKFQQDPRSLRSPAAPGQTRR